MPVLGAFEKNLGFVADEIDADVVHCHTWYTHLAGILAKLSYGVPLVVTVHSLEPLRPWKREQLRGGYDVSTWIERAALEMADAIIANARDRLKAQAPEADIMVEDMASYPALMTASTSPAVATAQRLSGHSGGATTVSFGTEAGLYAQAGIPTVVCGPGDIGRAHRADEWIGLDELAASDRMMQRLALQLDSPVEEWIRQ